MKSKYLSLSKARLPGVHLLSQVLDLIFVLHSSRTGSTDLLLIIREHSPVRGSALSANFDVRIKKHRRDEWQGHYGRITRIVFIKE